MNELLSRVGQKADFGLCGRGLNTFFADAESKNVLCWWRQSGDVFFQATCLYVTIESQFCGVKAESVLNVSMICGG